MIVAFKHMVLNDSRNPDFNQAHTKSSHKHYGHYGSKWVTPKFTWLQHSTWPKFDPVFGYPKFWIPQFCQHDWMNTIYPTLHQALKMKRQKSFLGKVRNTSQRLKTAAQELWQDLISIIWWFPLQKGGPQKISKDCDFFLGLYTQIYLFNFLFFFFYSQLNNMIKVSHLWTCRGKPKQLIAKTSLFCFATPPQQIH